MKRPFCLLLLLILSLSACAGSDTPAQPSDPEPAAPGGDSGAPGQEPPASDGWTRVLARDDLSNLRVAPIEEIAWNDDGTVALVRYISGAEPCSGSTVTVEETETMITFTLETGLTPEAAFSTCVAALFNYEIAVQVSAPVGDRAVVLAAAGDGEREQPDPFEGAVFPTDQYLGLSEDEARAMGEVEQRQIRVVSVDGEDFALTMDEVPTRVNIALVNGVVTDAYSG